jgi:hypothetical protein
MVTVVMPDTDDPAICPGCGHPLPSSVQHIVYCSDRCSKRVRRTGVRFTEPRGPTLCAHCLKPIRSHGRVHRRYCSLGCRQAAYRARHDP